jgi:hypothetical protein
MAMQLDYASILQGGQNLVPSLRDQLVQDSLMKMREQEFQAVQQQRQAQAQAAQRQADQEAAFQRDLEDAMLTGDPRKILALRMRYPDMAKNMKEAFDSLDEEERRRNLTQIGTIYARGQAGDFTGAAGILRQRIEADRAAGAADPQDEAMLEELESGVPSRQKAALAAVGIQLAAIEPDKFGETYAKLNPAERVDPTQREYDWRVSQFGKPAADAWLQTQDTKLVPVTQGGTVFQVGGNTVPQGQQPASMGGGDPSGSGAAGLTPEQFRANAEVLGPERAAAMTSRNGIPVRVRSVQEAERLPPGTLYETPTGERYTR